MGAAMELPEPSEIDPWDLDRLRLPAELVGQLVARKHPPRHRRGEAFLRGPIPFAWVVTACRLPGISLHVALSLRFLRDRFRRGRDRRWTLNSLSQGLQVSHDSVRRGLHACERAGLLSVARKPGCKIIAADVAILKLSKGETGSNHRPLYGPIPWAWLLPALRLPGPALQVAMACWLLAGWERSAEFEMGLSEWVGLGLSRFSTGRGLECLRRAGLVSIARRSGRSPIVMILDTSRSGPAQSGGSLEE